jgi:hypothetical protein
MKNPGITKEKFRSADGCEAAADSRQQLKLQFYQQCERNFFLRSTIKTPRYNPPKAVAISSALAARFLGIVLHVMIHVVCISFRCLCSHQISYFVGCDVEHVVSIVEQG